MAAVCLGDRIRCKDSVEGTVVNFHKYGNERHIVIKTDKGDERSKPVRLLQGLDTPISLTYDCQYPDKYR